MSISFKFRSSAIFDTVDIGNRASISVRELRGMILRGKSSQQQQQGFDLVFSDADTGLEYKGDDSQIPKGSSVIVKRVPGGIVPSAVSPVRALKDDGMKEAPTVDATKGSLDKFDDFGADLCMMPDSNLPLFDIEIDASKLTSDDMEGLSGLRLEGQKLYTSDLNEAVPRGCNRADDESSTLEAARANDLVKSNRFSMSNAMSWQTDNLLEMKCPLCNSFFKEPVLIPCCQHSFCKKCIHAVLEEERRCPKCFSSKCTIKNLLPNVSLDQTIQHFREAGLLDAGLSVPDGESGIQAKELSCGLSVAQKEIEMPQSSSVTGNGSNQVFMESYSERKHQRLQTYGDSDLQGDNLPADAPRAYIHDEADSNSKRRGRFWTGTGGGDGNFFIPGGYKKGVRTCYTCGSPDHLMRDCPMSNPNPMVQPGSGPFHGSMPGYAPPYWNGSCLPPFRPYTNVYSSPSMMPFNGSMVPVSPFAVPPYIPSICGAMPGPGGNVRMGTMGPPRYSELLGLQHCENRQKHSNEDVEREPLSDDHDGSSECYHRKSPERSQDYRLEKKESSLSHSGDSFNQRPSRKTHKYVDSERHEKSSRSSDVLRDKRPYHAERSSSGMENVPKSSDRYSDGRHKLHHGESKKYHDSRGHCDSDSSLDNHSTEKYVKRKVDPDVRGSHKRRHSSFETDFEPGSPTDRRREYEERDLGHRSRHYRQRDKHHDDRRHMSSGSDGDRREEYRHHKHRREC